MKVHDQYDSLETQQHAARLGMWVFLGSETLLFAALFALYMAYRMIYPEGFAAGVEHSDQVMGTLNTVVLITSSFTVALAVHAVRDGHRRGVGWLLLATIALAGVFLVIKGFEYAHHFRDGIYPGHLFDNDELDTHGRGPILFFTLYFFMTGLHALHVIAGIVFLGVVAVVHRRRPYTSESYVPLDLGALYWHLVDAVWIFLWPIFYLMK